MKIGFVSMPLAGHLGRANGISTRCRRATTRFFRIVQELAAPYAERARLMIDWSDPTPTFSKFALVSQPPKEFDLPGIPWPPQFHHTGPFFDEAARKPIPFPWEKLDGRPFVYAALGTLLNGIENISWIELKLPAENKQHYPI